MCAYVSELEMESRKGNFEVGKHGERLVFLEPHSLDVSPSHAGNKGRGQLDNGLFHNTYVAKNTVIIYWHSESISSLSEEPLVFWETLDPALSPSLCFEWETTWCYWPYTSKQKGTPDSG